jgi:hypothetical protein
LEDLEKIQDGILRMEFGPEQVKMFDKIIKGLCKVRDLRNLKFDSFPNSVARSFEDCKTVLMNKDTLAVEDLSSSVSLRSNPVPVTSSIGMDHELGEVSDMDNWW